MERKVLDTSVLIRHWRRRRPRSLQECTLAEAAAWAQELIALYKTRAIVTPVSIEFLAGVTSEQELRLAQAYLDQFHRVDGGIIPPEDWKEAIRLAQRVGRSARPRQLGDCLIQAIAKRLRYRVRTLDKDFPS